MILFRQNMTSFSRAVQRAKEWQQQTNKPIIEGPMLTRDIFVSSHFVGGYPVLSVSAFKRCMLCPQVENRGNEFSAVILLFQCFAKEQA